MQILHFSIFPKETKRTVVATNKDVIKRVVSTKLDLKIPRYIEEININSKKKNVKYLRNLWNT